MVAQFQNITVALGDGGTALIPQTAMIETGHDSKVTLTSGNGVDQITILANNSIWSRSLSSDDQLARTGVGGSTVKVTTGNGDKTITINTDNEGVDPTGNQSLAGTILDNGSSISVNTGAGNEVVSITAGTNATIYENLGDTTGETTLSTITIPDTFGGVSNVTVITGSGNDNVIIHGSDGNNVNVSLGAGDDRVQIHSLGAGIMLDGGTSNDAMSVVKPGTWSGGDTLATFDSVFASGLPVAGSVMHFENLEIVDTMTNNIDTQNLGIFNNINHVILDQGYSGNPVALAGLNPGAEIDLLNTAGGLNGGNSKSDAQRTTDPDQRGALQRWRRRHSAPQFTANRCERLFRDSGFQHARHQPCRNSHHLLGG